MNDVVRKTVADGSQRPEKAMVLSYMGLRQAVGLAGVMLPVVLLVGHLVIAREIRPTISDYYYTELGGYFVGSLCAIAMFMMSYHGYQQADDIAGDLACIGAIGVALVPTAPTPAGDYAWGALHYVFAATFLLTLAFFCLKLFTKTHPHRHPTARKRMRNRVYVVCGWTIIGCIAMIGAISIAAWTGNPFLPHGAVFWLESLAVWAFGWSWLVKGEVILKDDARARS